MDRNAIEPDTLELLAKRAQAAGEPIDDFLKRLLDETSPQQEAELSSSEWVKGFRGWVSSHAGRNYGFVDDSRESIYRDREGSQ